MRAEHWGGDPHHGELQRGAEEEGDWDGRPGHGAVVRVHQHQGLQRHHLQQHHPRQPGHDQSTSGLHSPDEVS